MKTESREETIRTQVTGAYTKALERSTTGGGCCSGKAEKALRKGPYGDAVEGVPQEAVQSSFGCGNPLAMAGIREGDTVLDLGSGAGLDLILAAETVGPRGRAIGVDMTPAMIEAARANLERAGLSQGEVREGIIEDLPVEDRSVDWVISNCVINLSPEKPRVFAEIARVLKPGGRFSISDIVVEGLPDSLRNAAAVYAACVGGAVSEAEYIAGLEAAGLVDVEAAERRGYGPAQIREIITSELDLPVPEEGLDALAGAISVTSVRFTGRKP